jgi:hypothetical protein
MILGGKLKNLPPGIRALGIFLGWIAGIILAGSLLWSFTQPARNRALIRSVNRILAAAEEPWRLEAAVSPWGMPGRAAQLGFWFSLVNTGDRGVIFPIISEGALAPCLAVVSPGGRVESLIPLSGHARRIFGFVSPGILQTYRRRVEASYALLWPEEAP